MTPSQKMVVWAKVVRAKILFCKKWTRLLAPPAVSRVHRLWGEVFDFESSGVSFRARTSRQSEATTTFKVTPTGSFRGRTPFRFCCSFLSLTLRSLASTSSSIEDRGRVQTLGCRTGSGLDDVAAGSFLIGSLFSLPSCCPLWSTSASASAGTSLSS